MEKHTCKLCFRSFANGRALGGHMRSHVAATTKATIAAAAAVASVSLPSESSSSRDDDLDDDQDDDIDGKMMMSALGYGLRENPKRSFRLVDPEFSSNFPAVEASATAGGGGAAGSSIVEQDRESETESSRAPSAITHLRRSKRTRTSIGGTQNEPEQESSISEVSPEEEVAYSLMLLSRDVWTRRSKSDEEQQHQQQSDEQFVVDDEDQDEIEIKPVKGRSKYQCTTCKKMFRSYQALGGHRASHKKSNGCVPPPQSKQMHHHHQQQRIKICEAQINAEKFQHECPVCYRVFSSGQALGGHKRSHLTASNTATITITSNSVANSNAAPIVAASTKFDLNLPAPLEDDAELSAVSDAVYCV